MNYRKRPTPTTSTQSVLLELFAARMRRERLFRLAWNGASMTPEDFAVYSFLRFRSPITPAKCADALGLQRSTLSNYLTRIESRGDLVRTRDPQDGRSVRIRLSAKGVAAHQAAVPYFQAANLPFLAALGDRPAALDALRDISAALEDAIATVRAQRSATRTAS